MLHKVKGGTPMMRLVPLKEGEKTGELSLLCHVRIQEEGLYS